MLQRVAKVPHILEHVSMLELLVKVCLNVDFVKGESGESLRSLLEAGYLQLSDEHKLRLRRRLTSEQSTRLPYSRTNAEAVNSLAFCLEVPPGEEVKDPTAVDARKAAKKQKWRYAKGKAKKRKRLFAMQASGKGKGDGADCAGDDEEEEDDSDDDDMPPPLEASRSAPSKQASDLASNLQEAAAANLVRMNPQRSLQVGLADLLVPSRGFQP